MPDDRFNGFTFVRVEVLIYFGRVCFSEPLGRRNSIQKVKAHKDLEASVLIIAMEVLAQLGPEYRINNYLLFRKA